MNSINTKISFGSVIGVLFFLTILLSIVFKDLIFSYIIIDSNEISESQKASQIIANAILSLEKVTLDTTILKSDYFSDVVTLPSFPTDAKTLQNFGKVNPFLGGFTVVSAEVPANASTTVGAVVISSQRSINNGRALTPVSSNNNRTRFNNR